MSETATFILSIGFLIVFWGAVAWLLCSKMGLKITSVFVFSVASIGIACALYLHWEPYTALVCLPCGFAAGVLFVEWRYDLRSVIARKSDLQRPPPLPAHEVRHRQEPRRLSAPGHAAPALPSGPGEGLRG